MKEGKKGEKIKMKAVELDEYLMLCTVTFMLSGIMLFLYCKISNIDLSNLVWFSDPLFFLGVGTTCMFMCLAQRCGHVFDKVLEGGK